MENRTEFREKILLGMKKAIIEMIEESAKKGESIVYEENGKIVKKKARQVLKENKSK